ncbi:hypothetical protein [Caldiplasma sukawensis]
MVEFRTLKKNGKKRVVPIRSQKRIERIIDSDIAYIVGGKFEED